MPATVPTVRRRRLFTGILVFVPLAFFALLELLLRLFHVGPDISLFLTEQPGSRPLCVMNPGVKARYFAAVEFNPVTSYDYFAMPKPTGVFRLFCLGGSTTVGFPYGYVGSFPSFLRDRLRRVFPDRQIEVINLGMTATNSFTTADIMREVGDYGPDLVIVYDGHNEFYGAMGFASRESAAQARWLTKLTLRLLHWRTFLLLRSAYTGLTSLLRNAEPPGSHRTLMEALAREEYVAYGSPTYRRTLEAFRANLSEIADLASDMHVPVIFGTQVSNLRNLAPFVSGDSPSMTPEAKERFAAAMAGAQERRSRGNLSGALTFLRDASALNPDRADVRFALAVCLDSLGSSRDADTAYVKARDLDELRFRTSSDFNAAIAAMAQRAGVYVADMEKAFRAASPDSLIGRSLILEHLHPNERGAFILAREYARVMARRGILAAADEWARRDTIADSTLWGSRPLTELDERCAARRIQNLTSRWPFTRTEPARVGAAQADSLDAIVRQATEGALTWERAHVAAAEQYERSGRREDAAREYRALINQLPYGVSPYLRLAQIAIDLRRFDTAAVILGRALEVEPTYDAARSLGSIHAVAGRFGAALDCFQRASRLASTASEQAEIRRLLAVTEQHLGRVSP